MSLRLEMLQVARLAPRMLGDSAELVREFLEKQQNPDGGFRDRAGTSDLYYTVFGLDALRALQVDSPPPLVREFVRSHGAGAELDFIHLCCLARCWAGISECFPGPDGRCPFVQEILQGVERFRSVDGGYHVKPGNASGTAYAGFLALGAYLDLGVSLPEPLRLVQSLKLLETTDGAWRNERFSSAPADDPGGRVGSTNATAAAVTLLRSLRMPLNAAVGDWLVARVHSQGGFLATPTAPVPDLLSTATALHALSGLEYDLEPIKEVCLDFVDTLWTNQGAFHGNWTDDSVDCEYTFYGLLALGHLSL